MSTSSRCIVSFVYAAILCAIVFVVHKFVFPRFPNWPLFAVWFALLVISTVLMSLAQKRGWIQSGLFTMPQQLKQREQELAQSREQIIAAAKRP